MKAPADKAVPYTAVVAGLHLGHHDLLLGFVVGSVAGVSQFATGGFGSLGGSSTQQFRRDLRSEQPARARSSNTPPSSKRRPRTWKSAQNSGDADAQAEGFRQRAWRGPWRRRNRDRSPSRPINCGVVVPERLGGLARSEISVERNAALGIQISQAEATYSDGSGKSLDLEITDLGGTMGLMAFAAWANIEQDRQTSTGFERTYKANNRVLHEVWDQSSMHGEFSVITANRFMVKIEGNAPNMDALKAAAGGIDLAALDRLGAAQASAR